MTTPCTLPSQHVPNSKWLRWGRRKQPTQAHMHRAGGEERLQDVTAGSTLLPGAPSFPPFPLSPALRPSGISWGPLQQEQEPSREWERGWERSQHKPATVTCPHPSAAGFSLLWGIPAPPSALRARERVHLSEDQQVLGWARAVSALSCPQQPGEPSTGETRALTWPVSSWRASS